MSQSVDTKVVELQFNNNNFEDKVESTLNKLQSLNKAIDEKGLTNSLKDLGKTAKGVDFSGISNGVEEATKHFSKLEVIGVTALANITNSAVNLGKKLVSNLISPITKGGLTRAMNIEQASFQFEGMNIGKSEGNEAKSYYEEVMNAVLGTAYSYDVAAKAASQLAASNVGVEKTTKKLADGTEIEAKVMNDQMTKALLGIAGVASMTGSDFESISQIFTRVAGQGRVMANDLNSIASRGLNAAAVLAASLGKTEAEVRDMVSKGQISFQMFSDAMSDAYGAHAKDSTLMFTGALEDVKAALARIGADFYGPALNAARDVLNSITPLVDVIHDKIQNALNSTGDLLDKTSRKVSQYFDLFSAALKWMEGSGFDRLSYMEWIQDNTNSYSNLIDMFIKPSEVREAIDSLSTLGLEIDGTTKKIDGWKLLADYLAISQKEVNKQVDAGTIGLNLLYKALKDLSGRSTELISMNLHGEVTKAIEDYIATFAEAGANSEEYMHTLDQMEAILKGIASLISAGKAIFLGFGRILFTIGEHLAPLGHLFIETAVGLGNLITKVADSIQTSESFANVLDSIIGLIVKIFDTIRLDKAATVALGAITKTFNFLAEAIERVHVGLSTIITALNNTIGKIIDKILDIISNTELLKQVLESIKNAGLIIMIINIVDMLTKPTVILEKIADAFDGVGKSVKGMFDNIGKVFKSIADMAGKIGKVIDEITDTLKRMQELLVATAILEIAFAIGVLAGALYLLSKIKGQTAADNLMPLLDLGTIVLGFIGIMGAVAKFSKGLFNNFSKSMGAVADAFKTFAFAIAIIAASMYILGKIDTKQLLVATAVVEALMFTMVAITKMLSSNTIAGFSSLWKREGTEMTRGIWQLIPFAMALRIAVKAIADLANVSDQDAMVTAFALVEAMMFSMALIIKWLSGDSAPKMAKGALTILAMAAAIKMLMKPIIELTSLAGSDNDALWSAAALIGGLMLAMGALIKFMSGSKGAIQAGVGIVLMAAAIKILQDVVIAFAALNPEQLWNAFAAIMALLGSIVGALFLVDTEGLLSKAVAFVAVAFALGQLSQVVMLFGKDSETAWAGIGAAAVALLVLAGACMLFQEVPIGGILKLFLTLALGAVIVAAFGAAIGVFGVGMSIFAAGLEAMVGAVKSISEIAGEFIIFMAALVVGIGMLTAVGGPAVVVILALSMAFLMLGAGFALIGSGVSNIAAAIKVISELDGKLGEAAKNVIQFVKELKKMDNDAEKVGASAGAMAESLNNLGTAANNAAKKIKETSDAGKKVAETFAKGIAENTKQAETAASNMANKAVAKLRNNYNQWYSVGSYLVSGLVAGLASKQGAVERKAAAIAKAASDALALAAKVHSPSRVWMRIGSYMGEGLAVGITKSSEQVEKASIGLASASELAVRSAIESISDAVSNDINTNPVITPVVDLSDVRDGASLINSVFGANLMSFQGRGLAASITHTIQNGGKTGMESSIDDLTDKIETMTETMNSRTLNNYINIDGAGDPEAFADGLIRSFRLNARTV